jgi:hypothetical protein
MVNDLFNSPLTRWQHGHIRDAADYFQQVLAREPHNAHVKALHEGLLDVLDPTRRLQRERRNHVRARAEARTTERRTAERRAADRRQKDLGIPEILDRRSGIDRRFDHNRRKP